MSKNIDAPQKLSLAVFYMLFLLSDNFLLQKIA